MGVAPYKYFTFDGESSRSYDVYLTGDGVFNAPERAVEMLEIAGRNGNYALDQGKFNNITVTYKAGIVDYSESDFADKVSAVRNWLCSKVGYKRLSDDYNPNEYRMAVYKSGVNIEHEDLRTGEFEITFDCKPQRWLTSGEEAVTIGEWGETTTVSGDVVEIEATATDAVKSLVADIDTIQDLNGYDAPWVGGAGKNKLPYPYSNTTKSQNGLTFTDNGDGTVTVTGTAEAETTFYCVASTSNSLGFLGDNTCILSGCPSGGALSTYSIQVMLNGSTWKEDTGSGVTFTHATTTSNELCRIVIRNGVALPTGGIVFKPMIRLSSESDATWQPYENICPISGSTEVNTYVTGKNLYGGTYLNYWYLPLPQGTTVRVRSESDTRIGYYKADKTQIDYWSLSSGNNHQKEFTLNADTTYFRFYSSDGGDCQITLANESWDYEPFGQTYPTDLERTVYGGTLDLVSGLLTVTHGFITIDGTESYWYAVDSHNMIYNVVFTDTSAKGEHQTTDITNNMGFTPTAYSYATMDTYSYAVCIRSNEAGQWRVYVKTENTSLASLKTWLGTHPLQLAYKLATPTTTTLTPQQVELLLGEKNNIWADSGDVTVEYGHNPMVLANPTQFDSEPLLAITGYGEIGFNGYTIDVGRVAIGDVILSSGVADSFLSRTITINGATLMTGDTITINGIKNTEGHSVKAGTTITNTNFGVLVNCVGNVSDNNRTLQMVADPMTFTYGTASTSTASLSFGVSYSDVGSHYYSSPCAMTVEYDGADTFTIKTPVIIGANGPYSSYSRAVTVSQITAYSTKLATNNIAYIDCEIGECWMESGGAIVSLNNVVTLGSDLPTLASGTNTFTYDNTVTDLKVTPRWWKV